MTTHKTTPAKLETVLEIITKKARLIGPSQRELAADLGVSQYTARYYVHLLERAGKISLENGEIVVKPDVYNTSG